MISNIQFSAQKPVQAKPEQTIATASAQPSSVPTSSASGGLNQLAALNKASLFSGLKQPTFSGLIDEDYGIEIRMKEDSSAGLTSAALRSLLLRDWAKKERGDTTQSLKLFIDAYGGAKFARTALADTLRLVKRPVDVIARSYLDMSSLLLMQQATGKRFIPADSMISTKDDGYYLGGRSSEVQIRRELFNSLNRDVEQAVMKRTGVKRSDLFWNELTRNNMRNSLESLAFGKHGLADAILVNYDEVVTRENLDTYLEENGLDNDPEAKKEFLSKVNNLKKLPTTPLAEFSPESLPPESSGNYLDEIFEYKSPQQQLDAKQEKEKEDEDFKLDLEKETSELKLAGKTPEEIETHKKERTETRANEKKQAEQAKLKIYMNPNELSQSTTAEKITPLGLVERTDVTPSHRVFQGIKGKPSYLQDDVIFFNDGFTDETATQITKALRDLDRKKQTQDNPSNIKLIEWSPGGSVPSGYDIVNTIQHGLKTDVDVIVTGVAASCGAMLLASATGNKLATPMTQIMIHEPSFGTGYENLADSNTGADFLNSIDIRISEIVSEASGRSLDDVMTDMDQDIWLSPLEAMFYGNKGLIDAILVGDDKVITKADATKYLLNHYGSQENLEKALEERIESLRTPRQDWKPEDHDEKDPFENPLRTIEKIAGKYKKNIASVKSLAGSVPREGQVVDHIVVAPSAS